MTHEILTDKAVPRSDNPLFGDTQSASTPRTKTKEDFAKSGVYDRAHSWGTQKYVAQMVPGYTGELQCKGA